MPTQDQEIKTIRVPLVGDFTQRPGASSSQDQQFINGFFEVLKNPLTGAQHTYFIKRPGLRLANNFSAGTTTIAGQGIYFWNFAGKYIAVRNNVIWSGNGPNSLTDRSGTGGTIIGGAAKMYFSETRPGVATPRVVIYNPASLNLYYSADAVTWNVVGVNVTSGNAGGIAFIDGYLFVVDQNTGKVFNCNTDDPTTWGAGNNIIPTMWPGQMRYITRQRNNLIVFSDRAMQIFVDAAITPGSPLQNVEQLTYPIGMPGIPGTGTLLTTTVTGEDFTFFIGNALNGGASVWRLSGNSQLDQISPPALNREIEDFLARINQQSFTTGQTIAAGNYVRLMGKRFYILTLGSPSTWVYDIDLNSWTRWTFSNYLVDACIVGGNNANEFGTVTFLIVGPNNPDVTSIYFVDPNVYQDNGSNFTTTIQTTRMDLGTNDRKFYHKLELIGDTNSSSAPITVTYSGDDYSTFSNARTIDTSAKRMYLKALGQDRRRVWKFDFTQNFPLRLEAVEFDYSESM